eukprot:TRINITY_DN11731_c0_g1_i1.p1 TRINITY_DN11731_c0_g1~~TRINITY_DN11731_c0_g1_i1.p1  ORF type:complete len:113 (-),score=16.48 TRINITY_DN11731_c0_g1_i1:352-663(-)
MDSSSSINSPSGSVNLEPLSSPSSGRSVLDWASIVGAFVVMYILFGGFFIILLGMAEIVRGESYRVLPQKFYGPFVLGKYPPVPLGMDHYPVGYEVPWNSTLF